MNRKIVWICYIKLFSLDNLSISIHETVNDQYNDIRDKMLLPFQILLLYTIINYRLYIIIDIKVLPFRQYSILLYYKSYETDTWNFTIPKNVLFCMFYLQFDCE